MNSSKIAGLAVLFTVALAVKAQATTPAEKCEAGKNKVAGSYASCRQKAESLAIKKGSAPDYSRCEAKFADKWAKTEASGEGGCPTNGDEAGVEGMIHRHADAVAEALSTGEIPGLIPSSGQTMCDDGGSMLPCPGTQAGQDGDFQWGVPHSYTDNGNYTITDDVTGLMWEKQCQSVPPGPDCAIDNLIGTSMTWQAAFNRVASMNAANFGGYNDWRLPSVVELQTILSYGRFGPAVEAAFDSNCTNPCSLDECSCTGSSGHWTSTSVQVAPSQAWVVHFAHGGASMAPKSDTYHVRMVRGGGL